MIGDATFSQRLFNRSRLEVAAIEDGDILVFYIVSKLLRQNVCRNPLCFVDTVATVGQAQVFTDTQITPQLFLEQMRILGNNGIGAA